ncbi:MAG: TonB-dependent receptor [Acidobacteriia bacterium]|nr:TonB-dependent receptor [Terriglobia bacterium]
MASSLAAQDVRARVQGLVTDASQAVIARAAVTLTNDATNVSATKETSEIGQYLFDFVSGGTYTVTVEMAGFRKFVQKNVLVQSRGDVTVNARLELGAVGEAVTVEASPVAVSFNSSTMALTLDTKMANDLPIIHRNPFLLASLNPSVVVRSTTEQSPYHHWAATQLDVGGNTSTKNDIVVDGASSMATEKSSYTPSMDAVQEVNLQQNAVDSEFGHSAGGVLSVQMKSGTNQMHGTAYYLGRNPALNAVADHTTRRPNLVRNHVYGGTVGNAIVKNKVFNFFSYEAWRSQDPRSVSATMPTDLERGGDFSQSRNAQGGLRTIHDPWTTRLNPDGSAVRMPFAGNRIPQSQLDPVGTRIIADVWKANLPGTGNDLVDNFRTGFAERVKYWNLSDRADWNVNDKLKIFGRFSMFKTFVKQDNYSGSVAEAPNGSERHSWNTVGDAVYTLNPTTVLNVRGSYNAIFDSFAVQSAQVGEAGLASIWGSNTWYKAYAANLPAVYYPGFIIRRGPTATNLGRTGFWFQDPDAYTFQSKVSKAAGRHYFKVGGEFRYNKVIAVRPQPMTFDLRPEYTANTFLSPNTSLSGDAWASLLIGAIDNSSFTRSLPLQKASYNFWSFFFQDDFKITQRLTLNLGLRYEYEAPLTDPEDRLSRFLDLKAPIPEFQGANAPVLPPEATALRTGPPVYNGAWIFTDSNNRGSWKAQRALFMPRVGFAYRMNDRTALRFGYARYLIPASLTDGLDVLGGIQYPGFDAQSNVLPFLTGVPQARLRDPYPGGVVPVTGKGFGAYTNLGSTTTPIWYHQDFRVGVNERINFTLQRELPGHVILDATYFVNFGRDLPVTRDVNQVDPRIGYQNGSAVTRSVRNPFFNILPESKMPGQLRTTQNVAVSQLLRQYPQYGGLQERLVDRAATRYQALQLQLQRPFRNGFNLVIGYNYNRQRDELYYDDLDNFTDTLNYFPAVNPRQRITGAAIYQLPFGKGRKYASSMNKAADAVFGGWALSGIFTFNTGEYLRFGGYLVNGDPSLDNPAKDRMFDTTKFSPLPAFTRRTNPLQYDGVKGMAFKNVDLTLAKEFSLTEQVKFELRMEAYNASNSFNGALPSTGFGTSAFGKVTAQLAGYNGRQFQYSGRIRW